MKGNPSASTWTRSRCGFASALSRSTARCCGDNCLRTPLAGALSPFIFRGPKPKACQGWLTTLHRLATALPGRRRGRRDDAHAAYSLRARVRRFTAPRYKTQRLDSDVSAPPTERCCGRRDDAHAAYPLRARVRRFTAPCYETQRFDSAVSSLPAERSRRRPLGSPVRTKT